MPGKGRDLSTRKNPCYKCDRRRLWCHSECAEYKKYRAELDGEARKRQIERESDQYRAEVLAKLAKKKRSNRVSGRGRDDQ